MTDKQTQNAIDVDRVSAWLASAVEGLKAPFEFDFIAGGRSNLTFRVTGADRRAVVLRRPPLSHVLATAHDMGREYRIISALWPTQVPVPEALAFCDDEAVNGPPFYVMGFVDGEVLRTPAIAEAALDDDGRRAAAEDLIEVLAKIHDVDVDAVGLGELGRRDGYIERQLKRWYGQFKQSQIQEKESGIYRPAEIVDEVHDLLAKTVPDQRETTIAHGDYRIDNTVIGSDAKVKAVLDWELCTLGDPLADLGTFNVYWNDRRSDKRDGGSSAPPLATTALPGFPTKAELTARYGATSGRDLSNLPFYIAFAHWKLACISEGVFARYGSGAMGSNQPAIDTYGQAVIERAERARRALAQL